MLILKLDWLAILRNWFCSADSELEYGVIRLLILSLWSGFIRRGVIRVLMHFLKADSEFKRVADSELMRSLTLILN